MRKNGLIIFFSVLVIIMVIPLFVNIKDFIETGNYYFYTQGINFTGTPALILNSVLLAGITYFVIVIIKEIKKHE